MLTLRHALTRFFVCLVFVGLTVSTAGADIPPPSVEACSGKKVGDTCTKPGGGDGICQDSTCSRTLPGPNGPETSTRDCVKCLDAPKKDEKKPAEKTDDGKSNSTDAGIFGSTPVALGAGAGVLLLGLFAARRFGKRA